jgi:uncharacterized protein YecT (DUF1311 family)
VRILLFAVFVYISSIPCHSQESAQFRACTQKEVTQSGLNICASDEAARTDSELNEVYQHLLSRAKQVPGAEEKVKTAQRAWIQYRDAYLEAMFPSEDKQAYGTMYPMNFDLVRAGLTREHTTALRELIRLYSNEGQ